MQLVTLKSRHVGSKRLGPGGLIASGEGAPGWTAGGGAQGDRNGHQRS